MTLHKSSPTAASS